MTSYPRGSSPRIPHLAATKHGYLPRLELVVLHPRKSASDSNMGGVMGLFPTTFGKRLNQAVVDPTIDIF